jgi:phage/plasmid-like protein (TIGR03299 family)
MMSYSHIQQRFRCLRSEITMSDNITRSATGQDDFAFIGNRGAIWHRKGQEMKPDATEEEWRKAAGLDWEAVKVDAYADLRSPRWPTLDGMVKAPARKFVVRSDTGAMLGDNLVSDRYVPHQPAELDNWFKRYISVDERFQRDTMGSLSGGSTIFMTAKFNGDLTVAGDRHVARLLMTTTFDGTGATINQATMVRVVCNNTLTAAMYDKKAVVRTRHNTRFDPVRVGNELAQIAQGFAQYKAMGDAMASVALSIRQVSDFFKQCLEIPFNAKEDDISTRKMNQFRALGRAHRATQAERNSSSIDAWTALNAITRWVDHDRTSENGDGGQKQLISAQFGSGAAIKERAVALLLPMIKDRVAA